MAAARSLGVVVVLLESIFSSFWLLRRLVVTVCSLLFVLLLDFALLLGGGACDFLCRAFWLLPRLDFFVDFLPPRRGVNKVVLESKRTVSTICRARCPCLGTERTRIAWVMAGWGPTLSLLGLDGGESTERSSTIDHSSSSASFVWRDTSVRTTVACRQSQTTETYHFRWLYLKTKTTREI